MREIKFRSWTYYQGNINQGKMDYTPGLDGYNSDYLADINYELNDEKQVQFAYCGKEPVPEWMQRGYYQILFNQYIGIKDKNEKEIYEGDIIKVNAFTSYGNYEEIKEVKFTIPKWGSVVFGSGFNLYSISNCYKIEYEVIGNIYENAGLLAAPPK